MPRLISRKAREALLRRVDTALEQIYRSPGHGNYRDPTTGLFYLLLAVQTWKRATT